MLLRNIIFAAGIGQGIRRSIFSLSSIMGPLWAGAGLTLDTYYVVVSVPLGLLVLAMVRVCVCVCACASVIHLSFLITSSPSGS